MSKVNEKAVFPKELLNDFIDENTRNWINEFRSDNHYKESYYQSLENIFKFKAFSHKPFNLFTIADIKKYKDAMIENHFGTKRIEGKISAINTFKNYLIKHHPDEFSENWLKGLSELRDGKQIIKYAESKALNLIQLSFVREYIKYNLKTEYIFEVFYQLGIRRQDFEVCSPKYTDRENMIFKKGNKLIIYNEKIDELLTRIYKEEKFKATSAMVHDHIKKIETYLKESGVYDANKPFTYNDILKTHEKYFFQCPNCGRTYENISTNWVLAKTQCDNNYYLVCKHCKGESLI